MTQKQNPSFEDSIQKLEHIVKELEGGKLTLEDALSHYEEGVKLSKSCQQLLADAEQKITILTEQFSNPTTEKTEGSSE